MPSATHGSTAAAAALDDAAVRSLYPPTGLLELPLTFYPPVGALSGEGGATQHLHENKHKKRVHIRCGLPT